MGAKSEEFSLNRSVESVEGTAENIKIKDFVRVLEDVAQDYILYPKQEDGFGEGRGEDQFEWSDDHYAACLRRVNGASAPGVPWNNFGSTKYDVIDVYPSLLKKVVRARVEFLSRQDPQWFFTRTPEELVGLGVMDPVKVFCKNELHKLQKLEQRGARLIWSVSLADELVHRYFFAHQDQHEIDHFRSIPSKSGQGLTDDHIAEFVQEVRRKQGFSPAIDSDCSFWDMCVRLWMLMWEIELRSVLRVDYTLAWGRGAINIACCLALSVVILSDGRMFVLARPGVQKSGVKITGSGNSHIRVGVDRLAGVSWSLVMSDDGVCEWVPDYTQRLARWGVHVKAAHVFGWQDPFEFCSTTMGEGLAEPQNVEKMVGHLLVQTPCPLLLAQFKYETRNCPERDMWLEVIENSGWTSGLPKLPVAVARLLRQSASPNDA